MPDDRLPVYHGEAPPETDDRVYPGDPDYDPEQNKPLRPRPGSAAPSRG